MTASQIFSPTVFGLALLTLCGAGAVGTRADNSGVRHAIEAVEAQVIRADTGGNAALWLKMYQNTVTPNFTITQANGKKVSREQYQENMLQGLRSVLKALQETYHIQRVTQTGNQATEEGFRTIRVSIVDTAGHMGPKGKTHLMTGRGTYRARWIKVGTSWRLAAFHVLKEEQRMDGKPSGV